MPVPWRTFLGAWGCFGGPATRSAEAGPGPSSRRVLTDLFTLDYDRHIGHVAAGGRADLFLIAPVTANTIAKFAHGLADDFLSNLYLSSTCPVLLAPAMDRDMYTHRAMQENLDHLKARGVHVLEP